MYTEAKPPSAYDGPILAIWTRDKSLDKLDTTGAVAICAAPWNADNIADWKANWNPTDVRTGQPTGSDTTVSNAVVAKGLEDLTDRVNLSTGLSHPSDRSAAIQLFRLFVQGGESYIPDEIRAWAVRHGWQPEDARDLAELAEKVQQGRKLKTESGGGWRADCLERLRSEGRRGINRARRGWRPADTVQGPGLLEDQVENVRMPQLQLQLQPRALASTPTAALLLSKRVSSAAKGAALRRKGSRAASAMALLLPAADGGPRECAGAGWRLNICACGTAP